MTARVSGASRIQHATTRHLSTSVGGDWRARALCSGDDPERWFPIGERGPVARRQAAEAQIICGHCPVRVPCRDWALDHPQAAAYGVWGGLTRQQRQVLLRRRAGGAR